jgi:hypothetical protein
MGENRFFYVESKSYEIVKNAIELSLIERSRNHFSIVTMGFAAAIWLRDVLLEVAKLSNEQNLFRSFREGKKIFVLQKQRNGKGRFVTITALGDSKSKRYVIIPEGRDACGWHGLSQEINSIMAAQNNGKREMNHRQPQTRNLMGQGSQVPNMVKESCTFKEVVIKGDMPNLSIGITGNQGEVSQLCNGSAKENLELSLKIVLSRGANGAWEVNWARVELSEDKGPIHSQAHVTKQTKPTINNGTRIQFAKPITAKTKTQINDLKPKMVWQPRVNGLQKIQNSAVSGMASTLANPNLDRVSVHSCDSESQISSTPSLIPAPPSISPPIAEVLQEIGEVDRSWGSSRDCFIDLRDGRRLRIPVDLRSPVAEMCRPEDAITQKLAQWVSEQREAFETDVEDEVGDSEGEVMGLEYGSKCVGDFSGCESLGSYEGNGNELGMVLTEDKEGSGLILNETEDGDWNELLRSDGVGDKGQKDLVPLNVEPLAVAFPVGVENQGSQTAGNSGSQSSDWVQRRQKAIGKVLGANYEGYEQAVTVLLMDIEACHLQRKANMVGIQKPMSSGRKGSRELKRLASSINYEARATREDKGKGKVQGGDEIVDQ